MIALGIFLLVLGLAVMNLMDLGGPGSETGADVVVAVVSLPLACGGTTLILYGFFG
jgi:hypothetical protein